MKRIICIVVIACLVPVCAFAVDLTRFNTIAITLGEEAIDETSASKTGDVLVYTAGNCTFIFDDDGNTITSVILQGNGTSFLSYAMAAIMMFDNNPATFADNAGKLFSAFLLAKTSGLQRAFISTGEFFILNSLGDGNFFFTIVK